MDNLKSQTKIQTTNKNEFKTKIAILVFDKLTTY